MSGLLSSVRIMMNTKMGWMTALFTQKWRHHKRPKVAIAYTYLINRYFHVPVSAKKKHIKKTPFVNGNLTLGTPSSPSSLCLSPGTAAAQTQMPGTKPKAKRVVSHSHANMCE